MFIILFFIGLAYAEQAQLCSKVISQLERSQQEYFKLQEIKFRCDNDLADCRKKLSYEQSEKSECFNNSLDISHERNIFLDSFSKLYDNYTLLLEESSQLKTLKNCNTHKDILFQAKIFNITQTLNRKIKSHKKYKKDVLVLINELQSNNTYLNNKVSNLKNKQKAMEKNHNQLTSELTDIILKHERLEETSNNRSILLNDALKREDKCEKRSREITDQLAICRSNC